MGASLASNRGYIYIIFKRLHEKRLGTSQCNDCLTDKG